MKQQQNKRRLLERKSVSKPPAPQLQAGERGAWRASFAAASLTFASSAASRASDSPSASDAYSSLERVEVDPNAHGPQEENW